MQLSTYLHQTISGPGLMLMSGHGVVAAFTVRRMKFIATLQLHCPPSLHQMPDSTMSILTSSDPFHPPMVSPISSLVLIASPGGQKPFLLRISLLKLLLKHSFQAGYLVSVFLQPLQPTEDVSLSLLFSNRYSTLLVLAAFVPRHTIP